MSSHRGVALRMSSAIVRRLAMATASSPAKVQGRGRITSIAKVCSLRGFHQSHTMLVDRTASEIADAFMGKFGEKVFERYQRLDPNQIRSTWLTLAHPDSQQTPEREFGPEKDLQAGMRDSMMQHRNMPIPPGWHLVYFTPNQPLQELGVDGTDTSYNPDVPYTRRMWAGGSIEWPRPEIGGSGSGPSYHDWELKPDDDVVESTSVRSCIPKTIRQTGETMLVVGVRKDYHSGEEFERPRIIENRNWIFRRALDPSKPVAVISARPAVLDEAALEALSKGKLVRKFNRTAAELFRFSALTFNAHRIHYDREWARQVEGHRDIVVHGPLNMISILDFWRHAQGGSNIIYPTRLDYRATSPIYVNEPYRILMDADAASKAVTDVQVVSDDGTVCMTAQITR